MYAKSCEKLTVLTYVCVSRGKNVSFLKLFSTYWMNDPLSEQFSCSAAQIFTETFSHFWGFVKILRTNISNNFFYYIHCKIHVFGYLDYPFMISWLQFFWNFIYFLTTWWSSWSTYFSLENKKVTKVTVFV